MYKILLIVIACLGITGLGAFFYLGASQTNGTIIIKRSSRSGPVTIYRDDYAIPHIVADNLKDALYGLGWAHAQDRLWSMHVKRMLFSGRLAEMFGPGVLRVDKFMRSIGIYSIAKQDVKSADTETTERVQSYADGINDYVATLKTLPLEFWLTQTDFPKWEPLDVFVFSKFLSFSLAHDWMTQLFRTRLAILFGKEKACEILACSSEYLYDRDSVILNDDELKQSGLYEKAEASEAFSKLNNAAIDDVLRKINTGNPTKPSPTSPETEVEKVYFDMVNDLIKGLRGSNSWIISGEYTANGKPILANDPHLDNSIPSIWAEAELVIGDETRIIGATIPGIPSMIVGKTKYGAWGITTLYADNSDVYLEQLNDAGTKYYYEGEWYALKQHIEVIKVRGGKDINFIINSTRHGPILTDIMDSFQPHLGAPSAVVGNVSFAWTGHIKQDPSMGVIHKMMEYKSIEDFKSHNSTILNPTQNLVIAFADGDIVYTSVGILPIRNNQFEGAFLKDGTKKSSEWTKYATRWENPHIINPKKGFIVAANNKFSTDNIKHALSRTQTTTPRAARITELIQAQINKGKKFTIEDTKKIQLDIVDVYARDNVNKILKVLDRYKDEILGENVTSFNEVTQLLNGWRGSFDVDSVAASIFSVWEYLFNLKLFEDSGLTDQERGALYSNMYYDQFFFRYIGKWWEGKSLNESFCANKENKERTDKPCIWNMVTAMTETYNYLNNLFGHDTSKWRWGDLHCMDYTHAPFSTTFFRLFYHRNHPAPGNKRTPNVAAYYARSHSFEATSSANLRLIVNWDSSIKDQYIIDTGVSESVFSKHYDDQMALIRKEKYLEMGLSTPEQLEKMKDKLVLRFEAKKQHKDSNEL